MTTPESFLRRAPLRRLLEKAGAVWTSTGDTAVPSTFASAGQRSAARVTLTDLSALGRLGFKGRGTIPAMKARGLTLEAEANRAFRQADGTVCLVLAASEVILLADPTTSDPARDIAMFEGLLSAWKLEDTERTYPILRRDGNAWFSISGPRAADMMAKICAVDLRPHKFADLSIAQTSVAKMSAIVARCDIHGALNYHVLADSAAALYFWSCLTDAGHEFSARVMGLTSLQGLGVDGKATGSAGQAT